MSWIKTIPYSESDHRLKKIYDKVKGANGQIDNVLSIHSLRPHSLVGHMALYKNVLHNSNNTLPKWYLEAIGVYVSYLNKCDYCVQHHYVGFRRLLNNKNQSNNYLELIKSNRLQEFFDQQYLSGINYAKKLTSSHSSITKADIDHLRDAGFSDGEILEINQVTCYFNYVNRMVVGLGVDTDGEILGLSPNDSDDANNWSHS